MQSVAYNIGDRRAATLPYPLISNVSKHAITDSIILPPNSKAIPLSQGKFAIVDDGDYDWLAQWKWFYQDDLRYKDMDKGYAVRTQYLGGGRENIKNKTICMGRIILNAPYGIDVDHRNGNKLDNRRDNLRLCSNGQNMMNRDKAGGSSKYKGVCWNKQNKKWAAYIYKDKKRYHLGYFISESVAALVYNESAKSCHGEFAKLNIVENEYYSCL